MKAQLDENLPRAFARALNELVVSDGHQVIHVTDYARGVQDVELFQRAAEKGVRVHITQDHHGRHAVEREAIARAGLTVFVLAKGWSKFKHYEQAARLIEYWPAIVAASTAVARGAIFRIPLKRNGKPEQSRRR